MEEKQEEDAKARQPAKGKTPKMHLEGSRFVVVHIKDLEAFLE